MEILPPGRELDALIEEKTMGVPQPFDRGVGMNYKRPPPFSTDLSTAWEVVEKIKDMVEGNDGTFKLQWDNFYKRWQVYWDHEDMIESMPSGGATGETAPHAICLAALKAVGWEGK